MDSDNESTLSTASPADDQDVQTDEQETDDLTASIPVAKPSLARKSSQRPKGKHHIEKFAEDDKRENELIREELNDLVKYVAKIANAVVPRFEGKDKEKSLKVFHNTLYKLAETEELSYIVPDAVNKVFIEMGLNDPDVVQGIEGPEQLLSAVDRFGERANAVVAENCRNIKTSLVNKNRLYQTSLSELNRLGEKAPRASQSTPRPSASASSSNMAHSEGLEALNEYVPTRDPFTRKPFKDIRVNARCGHVYEYESIMNMIISARSKGIKCPYSGCSNKSAVRPEHLRIDVEMARKISDKIQEEEEMSGVHA